MKSPADVKDLCKTMSELGVESEIIDTARTVLSIHFNDEGEWMLLASALRNNEHYHAALAVYETALSRFPDSHQMWGNLAILYREWERHQEALHALKRALDLKPGYVRALETKAMTLQRMQRFREAAEIYSSLLCQDPYRPLSWNNLGTCFLFIDQKEDAPKCFENANGIDSQYIEPLFNLALTYYESKEYDKALLAIGRFLRIKPDDFDAQRLHDKILKRPETPDPALPTPIYRKPLVVRLSTNLDYDGTLVVPCLGNDEKLVVSEQTLAGMSQVEAARIAGFRSWNISHLNQLVHEALKKVGHQSAENQAIFISYRWESDEHTAWTERFAGDLKSRGYQVVFDRFASREQAPPEIPELVSRLVQCNTFVAVLTERYRRRVEVLPGGAKALIDDGWVYDEWRCANMLSTMDRIKLMGIWRSGPAVPLPFRRDTVVDLRRSADYGAAMDHAFPRRCS